MNFIISLILILIPFNATAQYPLNWPWIGGNLNFADSPSQIEPVRMVRFWANQGVNTIQIKLTPRLYSKKEKISGELALLKSMEWADKVLDECKKNGIVGVVTFTQVPIEPELNIKQHSPEFWSSVSLKKDAIERVSQIVKFFRNRGSELVAYEFFNEPIIRENGRVRTPDDWFDFQNKVIRTVRSLDDRFIIVNAGFGGEAIAYKSFKPIMGFDRIIYGAHIYNPHALTHQGLNGIDSIVSYPGVINGKFWDKKVLEKDVLGPLIDFKNNYNELIWIGEFSSVNWEPTSSIWLCDLVELLNKHKFGWSYFGLSGHPAWSVYHDVYRTGHSFESYRVVYSGTQSKRMTLLKRLFADGGCS